MSKQQKSFVLAASMRGTVARAAVILTFGASATACSDLLGSGAIDATSISFRSARGSLLSLSAPTAQVALATVPITGGGHTIDVQSIDVTFDQVKLERVDGVDQADSDSDSERDSDSENQADSDSENDADSDSDEVFRTGATTVALPLDGTTVTPFTHALPLGTYDELQMKARFMRLRGTYDGQPFDVTVPVNAKFETELEPPFVVTSDLDRPNVTVDVDWAAWFRRSDGSVIDPRLLATDATLRAAFVNRVRASLRAFKDSNRDGVDSDSR